MWRIDRRRLSALEARAGRRLPDDLLAVLCEREPIREGNLALVTADRVWDIRSSFAVDDGSAADQLDHVFQSVGDVLPPNALPFAADWGGDFYCLMLTGPSEGRVVHWDHERDEGDFHVEPVADSIEAFFANLVPDPRDPTPNLTLRRTPHCFGAPDGLEH